MRRLSSAQMVGKRGGCAFGTGLCNRGVQGPKQQVGNDAFYRWGLQRSSEELN